MCAIAGILGLPANDQMCSKMLDTMKRRGPDQQGTYHYKDCTLLHSRLIIIDPEGGIQPMSLDWEGQRYVLVYNGELYNTEELRKELYMLGHRFLGHSDTEVLLHAYAQWKENCLQRLNGIYAFAVYNEQTEELFVARDRMGVKPLFYTINNGGFLFASEIKTLLAYPTVDACIDETGVGELLLLGPGRTPGSGVLKGIYEIQPGCCGRYRKGRLDIWQYWKLSDREHTEDFETTVEHTRYLVTDAITRQMVSDVPFGTFLSGGLDSSIISSLCAQNLAQKGLKLTTFSVDYENNDRYFTPGKFQPNSDNDYILQMQKYLNSNHRWTVLSAQALSQTLQEATIARDLPGMADVDFSLLLFCKNIRANVKMAISGECADEIFGGYPWYTDPKVRSLDGFPWAQNTKERASFISEDFLIKLNPNEFVRQRYDQTLAQSDILPGTQEDEKRMKQMVNLNLRWFMQTLLDRKDRMSMYSGLEVRVPFCDHRITEYLYGVPWSFKYHREREKGLLRMAVTELLPEEVLWRKKSPYPKTFDPAYLNIMRRGVEGLLQDHNAPVFSIVRKQAIEEMLHTEYEWPWYGQLMRAAQMMAYFLQINFWLEHYKVRII